MKKILKKSFLLVFVLIIFSFCFCGCGKINSMIIFNDDNSVEEIVKINLNNKEIENAGKNVEEIKIYAQSKAKEISDKYIQSLNDKIVLDLISCSNDECHILNSYLNGISLISEDKNGTLTFGIKFKTKDVYKYYYGINDNSNSEAETEEHFFYNKLIFKGNTLYARHASLYSILKQEFEKNYPELANNMNSEVLYTYVADKRREHSDADIISRVGDKYYHTWKLDVNNPQDKEITIYYNVANAGNCILVAVLSSLILLGVLSSVGVILSKIKKRKISNEKSEE